MSERDQLEQAIARLESQRAVLGDETVNTALAALGDRLAALDAADELAVTGAVAPSHKGTSPADSEGGVAVTGPYAPIHKGAAQAILGNDLGGAVTGPYAPIHKGAAQASLGNDLGGAVTGPYVPIHKGAAQASLGNDLGGAVTGPYAPIHKGAAQASLGNDLGGDSPPPDSSGGRVPSGERRQLTLMFCDLVGSTALSERIDPEDLRDVLHRYHEASDEAIRRFDGHIAKYLGDGLLVYFGYPQAHEDDAARAVHAGLGIVAAVERLNRQLRPELSVELAVRVGIHTGLVVVGEMGAGTSRESTAIVGQTPNIAARLQEVAEPNTVVVSPATQRLLGGAFTLQSRGRHKLKGVSQLLEVQRVLRVADPQSWIETVSAATLAPLVGRVDELARLGELWSVAASGSARAVLVVGEAGIGKSRLLQAWRQALAHTRHRWVTLQASAYHESSALHPVIEWMERMLQLDREDTAAARLAKLEEALGRTAPAVAETAMLFASLLSIPLAPRYRPLAMSPTRQKEKTLDALVSLFAAMAAGEPLVLLIEDLHWADPSTLELIHRLIARPPAARLLVLLTSRPGLSAPWDATPPGPETIPLGRLTPELAASMVVQLAGGKELPAELLDEIVTKTDGVPLFVEELTKMVLESGLVEEQGGRYRRTASPAPLAIPMTLQDSLTARLDRLSTVKEVAQLGATIGRSFSYELLRAVSPLDEGALRSGLARLVGAEMLHAEGFPPAVTYVFKHALIQEAAYRSLLNSVRIQYHQQIARTLVERFPEVIETQPELLAHHYTEGNVADAAVDAWQRAGRRALQRSANLEAIGHLQTGLSLLSALPEGRNRLERELGLQTTLGPALMAMKGYSAPAVELAYARARDLCRQLGETPQLFPVLRGLWSFYMVRGELATARELGVQLHALAERTLHQSGDRAHLLEAHIALGATLFPLGELEAARQHLEEAIAIYVPEEHRALAFVYGHDPGVLARAYAMQTLWYLGRPAAAARLCEEALRLADELGHPFSRVWALQAAARLHVFRREPEVVLHYAEATIALSREHGFPFWMNVAGMFAGWAQTMLGQSDAGLERIRAAYDNHRRSGAHVFLTFNLSVMAEAWHHVGRDDEARAMLEEGLATAERTGERNHEPELLRQRGELLLVEPEPALTRAGAADPRALQAEGLFRRALALAQHQGAGAWELRVATSLARLRGALGFRAEARALLNAALARVTDGEGTLDRRDAEAALA